MNRLATIAVTSSLFLLVQGQGVFAASASASFNVGVTVNVACTVSATDLNFGTFAALIPANTTASATATVSCSKGTVYALSFAFRGNPNAARGTANVNMLNGANPAIPASLTVQNGLQTATGGNDTTTIGGTISAAVINPATGTYTAAQAIYVLY
ncbi:MAG: spore coat protein U domain-containing protein [Alphaproteobacteria bacterium]|nr:spore coat protein U domain-containing protein [Alphaproteobacteria bacterium]